MLCTQDIRAQLEELDFQTQCIDDHVGRMEGVNPSGDDEVYTPPTPPPPTPFSLSLPLPLHAVILSYCHTVILSYYHTAIPTEF